MNQEATHSPRRLSCRQMASFVTLVAHKVSDASIFAEIAVGKGGCTKEVIDARAALRQLRLHRRLVQDFRGCDNGIRAVWRCCAFEEMGIEGGVDGQVFGAWTYGIIVACQVVHATGIFWETTRNARSLLKPGAQLMTGATTRICSFAARLVVEVQPQAFSLNFRNVMIALDQMDESVMGHWAIHVYLHWDCVVRLPDDISFETDPDIPMASVTAHMALQGSGRLERADKVLLHAAAGSLSTSICKCVQPVPSIRLIGTDVFDASVDISIGGRRPSPAPPIPGPPAVSVDWSVVKSVGYVAENRGITERLIKIGIRPIGDNEVLRVVESAIVHPDGLAQIITGIETASGPH
ncbi:polyketide synthase [Colletotrichum kahawae]|uniref:Polyketide synthase n=1 Tax=Colletotrichum kahawae TaxID=34407 RepID=A0AAD9YPX8_COLKA|nr:polyketide synthase [Colletotrichum kahawae]